MIWLIAELIVFLGGATLALAVYLQNPQDIKALGAFSAVILLGVDIARRSRENKKDKDKYELANALANYILEGNQLRSRSKEDPLPIEELNKWVEKIEKHLKEKGKSHWVVKLNDFSGYTFYSGGYEKSIEGRIRRLHEFINQLNV